MSGRLVKRDGARSIIQLACASEAYGFWTGMTLAHGDISTGLGAFIRRHLPWFFPRIVIVAVDVNAGIVTSEAQRWNWRRWKWEARR